jgi:hypothetical protein
MELILLFAAERQLKQENFNNLLNAFNQAIFYFRS